MNPLMLKLQERLSERQAQEREALIDAYLRQNPDIRVEALVLCQQISPDNVMRFWIEERK